MASALLTDVAFLVGRLGLAAVFGLAGVAKLTDRAGTRRALEDFGVPAPLAAPVAVGLPVVELAVAGALVSATAAWWGAAGALVLLLSFVAGISLMLARGRRPDCHCFGRLHAAPIGRSTLVRNLGLAAVAALIIWRGRSDVGPSVVSWLGTMSALQLAGLLGGLLLLGLLTVEGALLLQLLRQHGRLLLRLDALENAHPAASRAVVAEPGLPAEPVAGLPVGAEAPAFTLVDLDGAWVSLDALRAVGTPLLLVFSDPACGPCTALLPELGRWQHERAGQVTVVLVSQGTAAENRAKTAAHGLTHVLLQQQREVAAAYHVAGTPSAVLIQPDGTIGSQLAGGAAAIRALVAWALTLDVGPPPTADAFPVRSPTGHGPCPHCGPRHPGTSTGATAAPAVRPSVTVGDVAPPLRLPDLSGRAVDLADFRGSETLVLFWNPSCGFCQQLLPELTAWERRPPSRAPKLLVVSTGTVAENEALGLRSPVVLDASFTVGRAFGASGTPSAVLVAADGTVASPLAVGAEAVLTLAGARPGRAAPAIA